MKKSALIIFSTFLCLQQLQACDICGCGVGSYYIGILPDFSKKIAGLRYRYNSMRSHVGVNGSNTYLTSTEQYHVAELYGGWNIGRQFRVMVSVPVSFNERTNQGATKSKSGLGDISLSGYYKLFHKNSIVSGNRLLVQSLWIGAGIKLPTGAYTASDKQNTSTNANLFQLGTASVDFNCNLMYDVRLQDFGFNLNSSYKINTANRFHYSYGNKLSSTMQFYYKIKLHKKITIAPNAGLLFESAAKDIDHRFPVDVSGGKIWMGTFGMELVCKKISFGLGFQAPLKQDLGMGLVRANDRCMAHLSFLF